MFKYNTFSARPILLGKDKDRNFSILFLFHLMIQLLYIWKKKHGGDKILQK